MLEDGASAPVAQDTGKIAEKKTVKRVLIALIVILVLCIGAGITFKILSDRQPEEPEESTSEVSLTTEATTEEVTEEVKAVALQQSIIDIMISRGEEQTVAKNDEAAPEFFKKNGSQINAQEALALIVQQNINDDDNWNDEALKAMAVVIFTNLKYRDNGWDVSDVEMANTADAKVKDAVAAVYGDYLTYDDNIIAALFTRSSAGKTASSETMFGVKLPYLVSTDVDSDERDDDLVNEVKIGTAALRNMVAKSSPSSSYDNDNDPTTWIKILKQDAAVDQKTGYVEEIQIADVIMSGYKYLTSVDSFSKTPLESACFSVSYDEDSKEFVFTTYGYGYGVGLSQTGAIAMGKDKKTYEEILEAFYEDATLERGEASSNTTEESTTEQTTTRRYVPTTRAAYTTTTKAPTTKETTTYKTTTKATTEKTTEETTEKTTKATTEEIIESTTETTTEKTTESTTEEPVTEPSTEETTEETTEDEGLPDISQ